MSASLAWSKTLPLLPVVLLKIKCCKTRILPNQLKNCIFLHQKIFTLGKRKVYSFFKDNIWGADLVDMQLITTFNKGRSVKSWLQDNDIEMYSTNNEGKSILAERTKPLKNKIYKYMTAISKNVYIEKLTDIVNKCVIQLINKSIS